MIQKEEWKLYREIRLRALKDAPDAFGSTYEDSIAIPDPEWVSRLEQVTPERDMPLAAVVADTFVGLAWAKIEPPDLDIAHLYQMWVDSAHRGAGIGRDLIQAVIDWAQNRKVPLIVLEVTCGDRPARRLYESIGFLPVGEPAPMRPGSDMLEQTMELRL